MEGWGGGEVQHPRKSGSRLSGRFGEAKPEILVLDDDDVEGERAG
jgi:hypothetical protein